MYKDVGDIVVIKSVEGGGTNIDGVASDDMKYLGKVGRVINNNGSGMCTVEFPNGEYALFWEKRDLRYATKVEIEDSGIEMGF